MLCGSLALVEDAANREEFYIRSHQSGNPDANQWRNLLTEMHRSLNSEQWLRVVRRFEDVLPTSLMVVPAGHRHQSTGEVAHALQAAVPVDRLEIPKAPVAPTG